MYSLIQAASLMALLTSLPVALAQIDSSIKDYQVPAESTQYVPRVLIGCYNETTARKALTHYAGLTNARMSPSVCEEHCKKYSNLGSVMFGLTRGTQCQCGDALTSGSMAVPSFECRTTCPGDDKSFCGGTNRVNIYGPEAMLVAPTEPSVLEPEGCFEEISTTKRMNDFPLVTSAQMTIETCHKHCSAYQSNYMGIKNGRECVCGMSTGNLTRVGTARCNTVCGGGNGICGGAGRLISAWALDTSKFQSIGQWGDLIKFPVVPVAIALLPENGNLLAWSAGWSNRWTAAGNAKTITAIWDARTGTVSEATVEHTKHDMFCPGISMDQDGRIIVTGGSTSAKTSVYDSKSNTWVARADMKIPRGYQTSVTTSDGYVFTIGGSFGVGGVKDGETYNPFNNTWTRLPNSPARSMWMSGNGGFTGDSHAWLFGWKEGWIFQAGPSKQMNWYQSRSQGGYKSAGNRAGDGDSMCGVFVMYDAVAGKILSLGGSRTYSGTDATSNAHVITLGEAGGTVSVKKVQNGAFPRGFANGVVLPDGKVLVVGGMTHTVLFSNANPVYFPEIWDPETETFTKLRAHSTPRNYHSTAMLMPDGTVFSGGGGLCGANCVANHFDGQFFSPPYLFEADGKTPSKRPVISSLSSKKIKLSTNSTNIQISMAEPSTYKFSLIRMSTVTHAVNTDQRRIPLSGGQGKDFTLSVPRDSGITTPGPWMLFAVDGQGTPSLSETIYIQL